MSGYLPATDIPGAKETKGVEEGKCNIEQAEMVKYRCSIRYVPEGIGILPCEGTLGFYYEAFCFHGKW